MICPDFFRDRQRFITGGIKENTGNDFTGRRLFPVDYLPDVEEKIYRYRYHIYII